MYFFSKLTSNVFFFSFRWPATEEISGIDLCRKLKSVYFRLSNEMIPLGKLYVSL